MIDSMDAQNPATVRVDDLEGRNDVPAVRFASATEEISPAAFPRQREDETFSEVTADQLKAFTKSLHGRPLQEIRMNTFQFEAFSLPPSRVSRLARCGPSNARPTQL